MPDSDQHEGPRDLQVSLPLQGRCRGFDPLFAHLDFTLRQPLLERFRKEPPQAGAAGERQEELMMTSSGYSEGLRHGYADAEKAIREILAEDIPDAEKLKRIGWRVGARVDSSPHGEPTRAGCSGK